MKNAVSVIRRRHFRLRKGRLLPSRWRSFGRWSRRLSFGKRHRPRSKRGRESDGRLGRGGCSERKSCATGQRGFFVPAGKGAPLGRDFQRARLMRLHREGKGGVQRRGIIGAFAQPDMAISLGRGAVGGEGDGIAVIGGEPGAVDAGGGRRGDGAAGFAFDRNGDGIAGRLERGDAAGAGSVEPGEGCAAKADGAQRRADEGGGEERIQTASHCFSLAAWRAR